MECKVLENKKCTITSSYGKRKINGVDDYHYGVDIVKEGYQLDYIVAHTDGVVSHIVDGKSNSKGSGSYGNYVKVKHQNGYHTLYAHLQKGISVYKGQVIKKGQRIGYMGESGDAYGKHLHFEVWKNNSRINPTEYLNKELYLDSEIDIIEHKYQIGDVVQINGVYISSTSNDKLIPKNIIGKITDIIENANNPYLLENGNIGWVNDDCIIQVDVKYLSNKEYKGNSIVDGLNQIEVDSSFNYRSKLAKLNNIVNYIGSAEQNIYLLKLLKSGTLKC